MIGYKQVCSAIESCLKDAFPGRKINIFCGASAFYSGKFSIQAFVDGYGAHVTVNVFDEVNVQRAVQELLYLIDNEIKRCEYGQNR